MREDTLEKQRRWRRINIPEVNVRKLGWLEWPNIYNICMAGTILDVGKLSSQDILIKNLGYFRNF